GVQQLNVQTTLDWSMQQKGEAVVSSNLNANLWRDRNGALSSGLVAVQPTTGNILVMVGSPSYNSTGGQINYTTIPRNMGYPITLLEHVEGIATYADMGIYHSPEAVLKVTDSHGTVLYSTHPDQRARLAIDPAVAYIMAQIMADDQNRCMIFGCNSALHWSDRTVAAKTGTTDNFKDAVTIAFTPDLATGLWVGDILDNRHVMVAGSDGVFVASPG